MIGLGRLAGPECSVSLGRRAGPECLAGLECLADVAVGPELADSLAVAAPFGVAVDQDLPDKLADEVVAVVDSMSRASAAGAALGSQVAVFQSVIRSDLGPELHPDQLSYLASGTRRSLICNQSWHLRRRFLGRSPDAASMGLTVAAAVAAAETEKVFVTGKERASR